MKKGVFYLLPVLLTFIFLFEGTACMENSDGHSVNEGQSSQTSSSTTTAAESEEQIVRAILIDIHEIPMQGNGSIDVYTEFAKVLSGKLFGSITSEEDAKEKAIAAWIELGEIVEPPKLPINAKLYDEYDAWLLWESSLDSTYTDSEGFVYPPPPGSVLYIIIRKSDGKVLASWPA